MKFYETDFGGGQLQTDNRAKVNGENDCTVWNGLPLVIFGTSGISKEIKTIVDELNVGYYSGIFDFLGFVSESKDEIGRKIGSSYVVCSDADFEKFIRDFSLIGVVIPIGTPAIKRKIWERIRKYDNLVYPNIISPTAKIMDCSSIKMGVGNIICSGCILTTEIQMGNFNLININSTIGHNAKLGNYGVVNPLSSISGDVIIEDEVLLGAGCAIKQGLTIGKKSIVGLGAIITKNVFNETVMICQAAQERKV